MSLGIKGTAIFEIEIEDENGEISTQEIKVTSDQVEWNTEIHDADRQMGSEYVHIGTAEVDGHEIEWQVYDYAGDINTVNVESGELNLVQDFSFESSDDASEEDF
ncbi:hypothetical protein J542_1234 [Acinetobacter baumannii 299505]|uniref:hypothetical protein n=1 Tax=Acinetobacter calcoaceticus/baumannii complex TaxID=909768 RepID=UPI00044884C5|nr:MULTISPECIES: hypothetical protein [Acinetobacter calcoaceticus/baumannii complex]EXB84659.1 hypothetical protein J542_1234 [Acinetobacter baumannii 299505]